ncbi:MAG TPA: YdcF family protein [Pseudolabrys sp.]|nr:YdcF family protein [Pseudolabrys sp.]
MFFILSKTVAFFLLPSNFLLLLALAGVLLLATRWRRVGLRVAAAGIVVLAIVGLLPVGTVLIHALESRFPPWDRARGAPDGIVVLGGGISPQLSSAFGRPVFTGGGSRVLAMAKLARDYPNVRVVYSGGDPSLFGSGVPETDFVYPVLDDLGIARERVQMETRSRNTAENAAFTKMLVNPKPGERWLLVTSAVHMPRAVGCFRQAGFRVEAYPVGWETAPNLDLTWERRVADGLERLDIASYEWIGLLAYRLTGRTAELFPSP